MVHGCTWRGLVISALVLVTAVSQYTLYYCGAEQRVECAMPTPLPPLSPGFYHSALAHTHHVRQQVEFWSLALRCHESVERALEHHKHFKDMSDFNHLMGQARGRLGCLVAWA